MDFWKFFMLFFLLIVRIYIKYFVVLWYLVFGILYFGILIILFLWDEFFFMMLNIRVVMLFVNVRFVVSVDWWMGELYRGWF